ncbi:MAG TPA: glycosyltransferase family 4 protein [Gemmatimonadales bacterium]|nr:glycosyltransferase family 4 protein [Gemmatimonadales bacterium]
MVTPLLPHRASAAGGALVMLGQLEALAERHEVTLATFAGPDPTEREGLAELARLGVDVRHVWRDAAAPGLPLLARRVNLAARWLGSGDPFRTLKFGDVRMQDLLDLLVRERRFDVLQVEDNAMGAYRYPSDLPAVVTEHEVRDPASMPLEGERWRRHQARVWARFPRVQLFTARDAALCAALVPAVAGRVRVNPLGVSLGPAPDPACELAGELVFVGGFRHRPNVDAALWLGGEIMPAVRRLQPDAHLTIVGADPPPVVRALASDAIAVTGRVPEVEPFVYRAAVVLAPLRTGGGMRVKLLHALARGKAVVSTPLGAEGLGSDGAGAGDGRSARVPSPVRLAGGTAEFARAVAELLGDAAARRELGARGRAFVAEHHGWPAYARRLETIYRELGLPA